MARTDRSKGGVASKVARSQRTKPNGNAQNWIGCDYYILPVMAADRRGKKVLKSWIVFLPFFFGSWAGASGSLAGAS